MRIAILSNYDVPLAMIDNSLPESLHYYSDKLHDYLKGTASTFEFTCRASHEDSQFLEVGNKLSFVYEDRAYYMNIVDTEENEDDITVTAYSGSLELINDECPAYKSNGAMTFAQYFNVFSSENTLKLGINEVNNKSISHEWTGTDTLLARLFSLANVFDAEIEFVVELANNYSLSKIIANVYKQHSDTCQGIGIRRNDVVLRYGHDISSVKRKVSIEKMFTAIRPVGTNGLTINSKNGTTVYDTDGTVLYTVNNGVIYAPKAREQFPSNLTSNDRYIMKQYSYETESVEMLYGQALSELKSGCVPEAEYEISGYIKAGIGDTFALSDTSFNPPIYLDVRVVEQERSTTNTSTSKTVFGNVKEKQNQISAAILSRIEKLKTIVDEASFKTDEVYSAYESGELDGYTPVKGTDYFTEEEIELIEKNSSSRIEIGGRNLTLNSEKHNFAENPMGGYEGTTSIVKDDEALSGKHFETECTSEGTGFYSYPLSDSREQKGNTITYSFWAKCSSDKVGECGYGRNGVRSIEITSEWTYITHTFIADDSEEYQFCFNVDFDAGDIFCIKDFKTEYGNKATDWTQAPEDVIEAIFEASKKATDYIEWVSDVGLIIGALSGEQIGYNTLIDSLGMAIRYGSTELARYYSDKIELGKNLSGEGLTIEALTGVLFGEGTVLRNGTGAEMILGKWIESYDTVRLGILSDSYLLSCHNVKGRSGLYKSQNGGITVSTDRYDSSTLPGGMKNILKLFGTDGIDLDTNGELKMRRLTPKLLWVGVLSKGGSVAVSGLDDYSMFMARTSDGITMMFGLRYYNDYEGRETAVRFVGGYDDSNESWIFKANTTMNSTVFSLIQCSKHKLASTGIVGQALSINSLYGIA